MKGLILFLSIVLVVNLSAQEPISTEKIFKLEMLLEGDLPDSIKMDLYISEIKEIDPWISHVPFQLAEKGLAYSKSIGDQLFIGKMQKMLGLFYDKVSNIDTAIIFYEQALVNFENSNDIHHEIECHLTLGEIYAVSDNFEKSLNHCYSALELSKGRNDEEGIGRAYTRIGRTMINSGGIGEALPFAIKARDIFLKFDNINGFQQALRVISDCHYLLDDYKKSIKVSNEIIAINENDSLNTDLMTKSEDYEIRGSIHSAFGQFALAAKDYKKAREIYILSSTPDTQNLNAINWGEAILFFNKKEYNKAIKLFKKVLKVENEANRTNRSHFVTESLSQAYAELSQYDSAYHYIMLHKMISVVQKKHETGMQMEELKTKYETEKKEATIYAQEEELTQQKIIQWSIFGFAGILGLLFFQSFRNSKLRKIANEKLREVNVKLESKNSENELLLKEIHHRVKNNLQTISSLLSLQSESISDKSAFDAVQESKNRVTSMALIHQKLYQGENLAAIEMRDYFETIGKAIIDSFGEKAENISLKVEMKDVELDVDTAVPVGLITNELITNSLKHAFPNKQKGQILITLEQEENGLLKLTIADNGQSTNNESVVKKEKGFGTLLIQLLTTQLGGKLDKSNETGTSTMIQFSPQNKSVA
ncbi:MAG: two-component sensor histidine kinase/tetratricopeptide (TPR) repeat protein [Saprospiraceae bacterium]|jgi:two-component sensor histidine kinase/tetratricopeptide (TPR) repeat protein